MIRHSQEFKNLKKNYILISLILKVLEPVDQRFSLKMI